MGWVGGKVLTKGVEPTLIARTDYAHFSTTAQLPHTRTESHRIPFLPLPVDARNSLQTLDIERIDRGMNSEQEATTSNEEKGLNIACGARGREFKSHRPDHFSLPAFQCAIIA
jgi:hypothetical protein